MFAEKYNIPVAEAFCEGCKNIAGKCKFLQQLGFSEQCKAYKCSQENKVDFCFECKDFPCDHLHPVADRADLFPHNIKVFSLCKMQKMGVEAWAKEQAKKSFDKYYNDKIDL